MSDMNNTMSGDGDQDSTSMDDGDASDASDMSASQTATVNIQPTTTVDVQPSSSGVMDMTTEAPTPVEPSKCQVFDQGQLLSRQSVRLTTQLSWV